MAEHAGVSRRTVINAEKGKATLECVCGDYDGAVSFDTTTGMVAFEYDARFIQIIAT